MLVSAPAPVKVCSLQCKMHKYTAKQGWNLGFPSQMTAFSSDRSVLTDRCLQPQPPLSTATTDSFEIKVANLVRLLKNTLICTSTSVKGFRAKIQAEGSENCLRPRAGRGYRCVLLTSLYGSLLVPPAVVNLCLRPLSAGRLWPSRRTQQLLCPDSVM